MASSSGDESWDKPLARNQSLPWKDGEAYDISWGMLMDQLRSYQVLLGYAHQLTRCTIQSYFYFLY